MKAKKEKINFSHESVQSFNFSTYLEAIFLKSKAEVTKLIGYVTENINMGWEKTVKY